MGGAGWHGTLPLSVIPYRACTSVELLLSARVLVGPGTGALRKESRTIDLVYNLAARPQPTPPADALRNILDTERPWNRLVMRIRRPARCRFQFRRSTARLPQRLQWRHPRVLTEQNPFRKVFVLSHGTLQRVSAWCGLLGTNVSQNSALYEAKDPSKLKTLGVARPAPPILGGD